MNNYKEEQINEVDALEAIYSNEMTVISREPDIKYSITVKSDENQNDLDSGERYQVDLIFSYGDKYPDEKPSIEVIDEKEYLTESERNDLIEKLNEEAANNLGMVMVFVLVSFAIEWLNNCVDEHKIKFKKQLEKEKEAKEAAEMKKFIGTRVTVETFMNWKKSFDLEINEKSQTRQNQNESISNKKLTGRELFECDKTLNDSDLRFTDDNEFADETVEIDETLFQDLNDLGINDLASDSGDDNDG